MFFVEAYKGKGQPVTWHCRHTGGNTVWLYPFSTSAQLIIHSFVPICFISKIIFRGITRVTISIEVFTSKFVTNVLFSHGDKTN